MNSARLNSKRLYKEDNKTVGEQVMDYSQKIFSKCGEIYQNLCDDESRLLWRSLFIWRMLGEKAFYESVEEHDKGRNYGWNELQDYSYFSSPNYRGIVLFGCGQNGMEIYYQLRAMEYRLLGFCDNNPGKIGTIHLGGLPVFSPETLLKDYRDAFLIITPQKQREVIRRQIENMGFDKKNICLPVTGFACIYNLDPSQYFDKEIVKLTDYEVFLDAGAYDGETSIQFARFCKECGKDYKKIICFEPSVDISEKCRNNISKAGLHDVNIITAGTYSSNGEMRFDSSFANSGAATIDSQGDSVIQTIAIDDCPLCADASFIKMDIEGAELEALMGAAKTIRNNKPKLAICLYHKTEDIIKIPMYIESLRSDYKFFIRKYTPHHGEIVLYAV